MSFDAEFCADSENYIHFGSKMHGWRVIDVFSVFKSHFAGYEENQESNRDEKNSAYETADSKHFRF